MGSEFRQDSHTAVLLFFGEDVRTTDFSLRFNN